jgi:hypothetical protein
MRSRGTGPPALEYAEAAWLTIRAYIAHSLEGLRRPQIVWTATASDATTPAVPPTVDETDLA